ncbi:MAG: PhzF family phenazine biosynthesis protein [Cyanobacteria bacterium]|nr:PhzF family phenazine biosynthesis protein [Cyanobacteriota bacterium]MDW8201782.1 PhzF family phenazine biosynthesis protein [Cyanobacteriota bacterium SKYGB_h_bin112]
MQIFQVDAFTSQPFAGNPAAVCLLPELRSDRWLQQVAQEMNLSETAFLVPQADGFNLRWFTPTVEVDLCGHATLASAHVLWSEGVLPEDCPARFHTRSGLLTATRQGSWIQLDFPLTPVDSAMIPPDLPVMLGIPMPSAVIYGGKTRFDYLLAVESATIVQQMIPDFAALQSLPVRGIIVTSRADCPDYDFVSRFFAPRAGINEDPVTGSAHCALAPFWGDRLGKSELVGYQASARGGVVRARVQGDRVLLAGQAVTVLRGELLA